MTGFVRDNSLPLGAKGYYPVISEQEVYLYLDTNRILGDVHEITHRLGKLLVVEGADEAYLISSSKPLSTYRENISSDNQGEDITLTGSHIFVGG